MKKLEIMPEDGNRETRKHDWDIDMIDHASMAIRDPDLPNLNCVIFLEFLVTVYKYKWIGYTPLHNRILP